MTPSEIIGAKLRTAAEIKAGIERIRNRNDEIRLKAAIGRIRERNDKIRQELRSP